MAIKDPLHQDEVVVEEKLWIFTREWYSWLGGLIEAIRAELAIKAVFEEGTFVPMLSFGGGTTGIAYTIQTAKYTKIHNVVYFSFRIDLSSKGTSVGDAVVAGLPFANGDAMCHASSSGHNFNLPANSGWMALIGPSSSDVTLMEVTAAGNVVTMTNSDFTDTSDFVVTGFYFTGV